MKIAFGVFDWGLGHATRSTPLINELINQGHEVHIISTGRALIILKNNFKDKCIYHDLPSIFPPYSKIPFHVSFVLHASKMIKSLKEARKHSKELIEKEKFDIVISDARYDVYDTPENSLIIKHQVRFKAPIVVQNLLEKFLANQVKHYRYVLVPDFPGEDNLSGILSHNLKHIPKEKIKYMGIISNIKRIKVNQDVDYFISLSGPEPGRTRLEKKILSQLPSLKGKIIIAGGNPECNTEQCKENVEFYSFLNSKEQENIMNRAKFVITRSGYTTIMELAELEKNQTLLIPTSGQTEQEYLGDYYEKKGYFHHVSQFRLNLKKDIEKCRSFKGFNHPWKTQQSLKNFIEIINNLFVK